MLQDENKMYTEKEAIELANKMIYEKAKQTYQIAINKMAQDFGIDKANRRTLDIDKDDVKMYLGNPIRYKRQMGCQRTNESKLYKLRGLKCNASYCNPVACAVGGLCYNQIDYQQENCAHSHRYAQLHTQVNITQQEHHNNKYDDTCQHHKILLERSVGVNTAYSNQTNSAKKEGYQLQLEITTVHGRIKHHQIHPLGSHQAQ